MKNFLFYALLVSLVIASSSCASIVSKNAYPVSINSAPNQAKVTIVDQKGVNIYSGKTPVTVELKSSASYFKRATYLLTLEAEGFEKKVVPIEFKVDGWYWGNFLFGGLIGFLIVDPASGAMYKLKTPPINESLIPSTSDLEKGEQFEIRTIDQIPDSWKENLVLLD